MIDTSAVFGHNFWWVVAFQLGLNFTQLDFIPGMSKFTLTAEYMARWNTFMWILLVVSGIGVLGLIAFVGALMVASGIIVGYVSYLVFLAVLFAALSVTFPKQVHVHHYFWALVLMTLCGHPNLVTTIAHGILTGIFIEGCARWSLAPVW